MKPHAMTMSSVSCTGALLAVTLMLGGCASAPESSSSAAGTARVDLTVPRFDDSTSVTNPLFPMSALAQVIQVGAQASAPLRNEVTLLPRTRSIEWNGQTVQTLVSQYAGYRDGQIIEVAHDYFAQADDGSVWYFGEDVDNYENGVVADHEGTWLAGRDGPPGMIMPAAPRVGDVYRPENIPDLVFEEVTVKSVNERVEGPNGAVGDALLVQERLLDGTLENKVFAPGLAEFAAEVPSEDELVTVSVAAPVETNLGAAPPDLLALSRRAVDILDAVASPDWARMGPDVAALTAAWDGYRTTGVPPLIEKHMSAALTALGAAVSAQQRDAIHRSATEVAHGALDLSLQHRPVWEVDLDRLDLHTRQLMTDAHAGQTGLVRGDTVTLRTIWDRTAHAVAGPGRANIDAQLTALRAAADKGDVTAAAGIGQSLHVALTEVIAAGG